MRLTGYISVLIILLIAACDTESPEPDSLLKIRELTYEEETLLRSSNEFSFELLRMLNERSPDKNAIFSSFGIGNGIGMAFNIMENRPKQELKSFLKISEVRDIEIHKAYFQLGEMLNMLDRDVQFTRANSLWINNKEKISPLSGDKIMAYYDADIDYLDFGNEKSVRTINKWVENRSYGKVQGVLNYTDPKDKSYIINSIHFDVYWNVPFHTAKVNDFMFTTLDGKYVPCKRMNLYSGDFATYSTDYLTILDIPLGKKQFYLSLIIPERTDDFETIINFLNPDVVTELLSKTTTLTNDIILPEININSEVRLKGLFPQFGLSGPIEVIKGFYPMNNLFISDFIHKTSFSLSDEENLENDELLDIGSIASSDPLLIDRPFIFLVREKFTGAIIFTGILIKPA